LLEFGFAIFLERLEGAKDGIGIFEFGFCRSDQEFFGLFDICFRRGCDSGGLEDGEGAVCSSEGGGEGCGSDGRDGNSEEGQISHGAATSSFSPVIILGTS